MSMGKGSGRRPPAISDALLEDNWSRTFGFARREELRRLAMCQGVGCGLPECPGCRPQPPVDMDAHPPQITGS